MISIFIKKINFIILFFSLCLFTSISNANNVVYINLSEIMNNSIVGNYINTIIKDEQTKISEKFLNQEKELRNKENNLLGKKNILKNEEYQNQVIQLQNEVKLYNKNRKKILDELNKKKAESSKKVFEKLNPILTNYMETNSISLILKKKDVIVGRKSLDITLDIIELLNKEIQEINF